MGYGRPAPLAAHHDPSAFRCGQSALDDWLVRHARSAQASGSARVFVTTHSGAHLPSTHSPEQQSTPRAHAPPTRAHSTDAVPHLPGNTPQLFIGTVERTWRAALGVSATEGPLTLTANAGLHHVENEGNVSGRTKTRFVGRVQATLGLTRGGHF